MPRFDGRRLPIGAEPAEDGGAHFRVWAPRRRAVELVLEGTNPRSLPMGAQDGGYFAVHAAEARTGTLYRFRLDGEGPFPDPASRWQPEGPHGPSQVVDPSAFHWNDRAWRGVPLRDAVFYELHVGTFTREGTWQAAARELPRLRDLGITMVELMPVAEFAGRFGWGYDGVDLYAPTRLYGSPDQMRNFVDRAHALGMGVMLDVVYNHLGPDGNYLEQFSTTYFTDRYENEWGRPINFDGGGSLPVRELFVANAGYWIDEFHLDGLRLDATQQIFDSSGEHVVAAMVRRAREAARGRRTLVVVENELQDARALDPPERGGWGVDAVWNDDFHHAARVALLGGAEAYFSDYRGTPQELISALKRGWLFQGQRFHWQKKRRGTSALHLVSGRFIIFLENHDQAANSSGGQRLHEVASPALHRAMTALLLLSPCPPLLFQGQEVGAASRWHYFADHRPELATCVREGRWKFMCQFPSTATPEMQELLTDPGEASTFEGCKLQPGPRAAQALALHRDLLRLRRDDPSLGGHVESSFDGAVLADRAFVLRWMAGRDDRLLAVNLGARLRLEPAPEPLLGAPAGSRWATLWSSEDPRYGGCGTPALDQDDAGWCLPPQSAVLLQPLPRAKGQK